MLVMKTDGRYAYGAVDGEFIKIRNKGYQVGDLVAYFPTGRTSPIRTIMAVAACFMILVAAGGAVYSYPVMVIDVDINPSVEIGTNLLDRVVMVQGNNADGETFVQSFGVKNQNIDQVLQKLLQKAEQEGYIDSEYDDNGVCISIYASSTERASALEAKAKRMMAARQDLFDVQADLTIAKGSSGNLKTAKSEGISMAKAGLIQKVMDTTPEVTKEMLRDKPIFVLKKISSADTTPETKAKIVKIIKENREKITRKKADEIDKETDGTAQTGENAVTVQESGGTEPKNSEKSSDTQPSGAKRKNDQLQQNNQRDEENKQQTPAPTIAPENGTTPREDVSPSPKGNTRRRIIKRLPGLRQRIQDDSLEKEVE